MRIFIVLIVILIIPGIFPISPYAQSAEIIPVCYLQLIDEERYIYRSDMDKLNWLEIRKQRELNRTANLGSKFFGLKLLENKTNWFDSKQFDQDVLNASMAFMRDPNGVISQLYGLSKEKQCVKIPKNDNLIGRYLVGVHISLGNHDVDGNGSIESVHICAKFLTTHYKNGGEPGSKSVVFFDDAEKMPLEIGPVINTAISKYGGGSQRPHRSYEMMVKYLNLPLPGVKVNVFAMGSQWKKTFVTDKSGKFEIMPTDDRSLVQGWQKYIFYTSFHDKTKKSYYSTTFPVVVRKNQPEWRSRTMGFTLWSIIGSALTILIVWGFVQRKTRLKNLSLAAFKNHGIHKDKR